MKEKQENDRKYLASKNKKENDETKRKKKKKAREELYDGLKCCPQTNVSKKKRRALDTLITEETKYRIRTDSVSRVQRRLGCGSDAGNN